MTDIIATSAVTSFLIILALWLSRTWIKERLVADIRLENDSKLEKLKSQLQRTNETLTNITSAGGQAYSQSQVAILPYKIKAIETVWNSILAWHEMSVASMFVAVLPISWVRKNGADPSTKEHFEMLLQNPNHLKFLKERNYTELVRPFISERSWALYSAYNSFYISRITKASMFLISSVNHVEIWEKINERELIKASAPSHILELYDSNILEGTTEFLNYLKEEMIKEFEIVLSGKRDSESAASNAAFILKAAVDLAKQTRQQATIPQDEPIKNDIAQQNAQR